MENTTQEIIELAKKIETVRKQNERLMRSKEEKKDSVRKNQEIAPVNLIMLNHYESSVFATYEDIGEFLINAGVSNEVTSDEDARAFVRMFNLHPAAQLKEEPNKRGRGHFLFFVLKVKEKIQIMKSNRDT